MKNDRFIQKYGPWAVIAGGSTGIGEAFAKILAQLGFNLVLIARRKPLLEKLSKELNAEFRITVRTIAADLAEEDSIKIIREQTRDIEVNLLIYNAAVELMGPFFDHDLKTHLSSVYVNCRGPIIFIEHFGRFMKQRKKGGIILISSMACMAGSPFIAHYGASKAFINNLAEGLWYELKEDNIDVISCIAGNTKTPNYIANNPNPPGALFATEPMDPMLLAKEAVNKLGRVPSFYPGSSNKFAAYLMTRLLPRKQTIILAGKTVKNMFKDGFPK